ncbi:unnamed protein product [Amoebophrya sp. A25]|nr:unnamed protein product [Amoebophrya sp. A25]|eukprot:GSA25T00010949001.1
MMLGSEENDEEGSPYGKNIPAPQRNEILRLGRQFTGRHHWSQRLETWQRFMHFTDRRGGAGLNSMVRTPETLEAHVFVEQQFYYTVIYPRYLTFHGIVASALRAKQSPYCPREHMDILQRLTMLGVGAHSRGRANVRHVGGASSTKLNLIEVGPHFGDCMLWSTALFGGCSTKKVRVLGLDIDQMIVDRIRRAIRLNGFENCATVELGAVMDSDYRSFTTASAGSESLEDHEVKASSTEPPPVDSTTSSHKDQHDVYKRHLRGFVKTLDQILGMSGAQKMMLNTAENGVDIERPRQRSRSVWDRSQHIKNFFFPITSTAHTIPETDETTNGSEREADSTAITVMKIHVVGHAEHRILYGARSLLRSCSYVLLHVDYPEVLLGAAEFLSGGGRQPTAPSDDHEKEREGSGFTTSAKIDSNSDVQQVVRQAAEGAPGKQHQVPWLGFSFLVFQVLLKGLSFYEFNELRRLYWTSLVETKRREQQGNVVEMDARMLAFLLTERRAEARYRASATDRSQIFVATAESSPEAAEAFFGQRATRLELAPEEQRFLAGIEFTKFTEFYFNLHPKFIPRRLLSYFFNNLQARQFLAVARIEDALV